jgi:hypothetical protein
MERTSASGSYGLQELPWALRRCIVSFLPTADAMTVSSIRPLGISVSTIAPQRFLTTTSFEKHINADMGGQLLFAMPIPIYAPVFTTHSVSIKFVWRYVWYSSIPKFSVVAIYKDETLPQATQANAFPGGRIVCESVAISGRGKISVASFGLRDNKTYYLCFRGEGRIPDLHHHMEDFFVTAHIYDDRQQMLSRIYRQLRTLGIEQMEKEYGASHVFLLASCRSLTRQLCDRGGRRGTLGDRQMVQFLQEFDIPIVAASLRAMKDCILSELEVNRRYEDADRAERQAEEIRIMTLRTGRL